MSTAAPELDRIPENGSPERLRLRAVETLPPDDPELGPTPPTGSATGERMVFEVHRVGVASLARTVACLAALGAAALIGTGLTLWWLAGRVGLLGTAESAMASTLGLDSWTMPSGVFLIGWIGAVGVLALVVVSVTVLLAVAFNRIGRGLGGVEVLATPGQPDPRG